MAAHSHSSSLKDLVGEAWIGPVHCAGREILRRIFITVRDRNWQEIRPAQFDSVIEERTRTVRLSARHTSELVDFEWKGELALSEDGRELSFGFQGRALRDMDVCRLGLIVLHSVEAMVGSRVATSNGRIEQSLTVVERLAPQPIVDGIPGAITEPFTELRIERGDWGQIVLLFEGESFELEDQRNWGDASFKTYCTPLRKGFPRPVKNGTSIAHRVKARFVPSTLVSARSPQSPGGSELELDPTPTPTPTLSRQAIEGLRDFKSEVQHPHRLPTIGCIGELPRHACHDGTTWTHIYVDLTGHSISELRRTLEHYSPQQLEIALEATPVTQDIGEWASLLRAYRERVARLLFYGRGTALPSAPVMERWRGALDGSTGKSIPLFAATRGYFVEFNRSVPFRAPVSGIAFPLTATVHSDDAETVMSNVATIRAMAETGRRLTHVSEIALAPLAFRYPPGASLPKPSNELVQNWLTATLRHAIGAGVTSITLADDVAAQFSPAMLRTELQA